MNSFSGVADQDLLQKFVATRDPQLFAEIYQRNFARVYRYIYGRLGNVETSRDIAAETFITLWEISDKFNHSSQVSTFIIGIARNKLMQLWSSKEFSQLNLEDNDLIDYIPDHASDEIEEEIEIESADFQSEQTTHMVAQILESLPDNYHQVLRLRFLENKSIKETAQILQISPGNVKVLQHRAVEKAQKLWNETTQK